MEPQSTTTICAGALRFGTTWTAVVQSCAAAVDATAFQWAGASELWRVWGVKLNRIGVALYIYYCLSIAICHVLYNEYFPAEWRTLPVDK